MQSEEGSQTLRWRHNNRMASQITSLTIVYSSVYSGEDQRKHQSSASVAFVRGINQWSVNAQHKEPVMQKMFPFDDVIMENRCCAIRFSLMQEPHCSGPRIVVLNKVLTLISVCCGRIKYISIWCEFFVFLLISPKSRYTFNFFNRAVDLLNIF